MCYWRGRATLLPTRPWWRRKRSPVSPLGTMSPAYRTTGRCTRKSRGHSGRVSCPYDRLRFGLQPCAAASHRRQQDETEGQRGSAARCDAVEELERRQRRARRRVGFGWRRKFDTEPATSKRHTTAYSKPGIYQVIARVAEVGGAAAVSMPIGIRVERDNARCRARPLL